MKGSQRLPSAPLAVSIGLLGLAAAMGIGRFAFTPLLPLMQQHQGVTLVQGAWLASANYLGYFVGALACFALAPEAGRCARWGLLAVTGSTLAMGATDSLFGWCALRLLAGVASAFVLTGVSAWALAHLGRAGRPELAGWIFAGVGFGIGAAGLLTLAAATAGLAPAAVWVVLGVAAAATTALAWRPLGILEQVASSPRPLPGTGLDRDAWVLIACHGAFGYGYIVPATFLPVAARSLVADPAVFGWAWPLFGLAAAASTIVVSKWFRRAAPRTVAGWSMLVMSVGVLMPALRMGLLSIALSAACVGGTFMVLTMAGIQEARRITHGDATRLIAGLTGAFAIGQFAGPLLVGAGSSPAQALVAPSHAAAAALGAGGCMLLLFGRERRAARAAARPPGASVAGDRCESSPRLDGQPH